MTFFSRFISLITNFHICRELWFCGQAIWFFFFFLILVLHPCFLLSRGGANSIFPHNLSCVISSGDRGIIDGYLILAGFRNVLFHYVCFVSEKKTNFLQLQNVLSKINVAQNNENLQMCGFIVSKCVSVQCIKKK